MKNCIKCGKPLPMEDALYCCYCGKKQNIKVKAKKTRGNVELVEKYKSEAADYICSKYDWDDVVERTLKLYRR